MGLLDRITAPIRRFLDPSPAAPPPAPEVPVRLATPNPWHARDAEVFGNRLTVQLLTEIIHERNAGYLQRWVDLADEAREKDPHLHSQLGIREQSVVETEFVVKPGLGSNQRAARRAADAFRERFEDWRSRPDNGLDTWLAEVVGAQYYGRAVHEVLWAPDGRLMTIEGLDLIDTRRFGYACAPRDPQPWALRLWDPDVPQSPFAGTYGVPLAAFPDDKLLVTRPRVRGAQPSREGIFATLVYYWLFKNWAVRDVMALAEMLGRPPIIGYYNAGGAKADGAVEKLNGGRLAAREDIETAKKTIRAISGALRTMLPDTIRLEALEYKTPASEPVQLAIAKLVDAYESKAINGSTGVSDIVAGARASHEVAERASYTFWRTDCKLAARQFSVLGCYFARANPGYLGADCPAPVVEAQTKPAVDVKAGREKVDAAREHGLETSEDWVRAQLGDVPKPAKGQARMAWVRPVAPPAPDSDPTPTDPHDPAAEPSEDPAEAPDAAA